MLVESDFEPDGFQELFSDRHQVVHLCSATQVFAPEPGLVVGVAQQHIFPEQLVIVAVGPVEELRRQLGSLAEPQIDAAASLLA